MKKIRKLKHCWWEEPKTKAGRPRKYPAVILAECEGCWESFAGEPYITVAIVTFYKRKLTPLLKLYYHPDCFDMLWGKYLTLPLDAAPLKERVVDQFYDIKVHKMTPEDRFAYGL